jgi:hypothetical protein
MRERHGGIQPDAHRAVQHLVRQPHPGQRPVPGRDPRPRVPRRAMLTAAVTRLSARAPPRAISASVRHAVGTDVTSPNSSR